MGLAGSASGALVDMAGHWAAPLVGALEARGIIAGDPDGSFHPEAPLTRAQLAKLLTVALGNQANADLLSHYSSRYTDVPNWHWAKGYIEALVETGAAEGYGDGTFGPGDTVTRAQMAVFLVRSMGLNDQARLLRFSPTPYTDDRSIPDWARGSVQVALQSGLMAGFGDNTFRPNQPVTRAEASVAILRLTGRKGMAYDLTGTLVRFDASTRQAVVRDPLGQEKAFTMAADAEYFRGGVVVQATQVAPPDQVWLVLGPDGVGRFIEARYADLLVQGAVISGTSLMATMPDGSQRTLALEPGAIFLLNGQVVTADQMKGATPVYLALDTQNNDVRLVDGVAAQVQGKVAGLNSTQLFVNTANGIQTLNIGSTATLYLNGLPIRLTDLQVGDRVWAALDASGTLTYLQAER
ncbi:MAG: S-layer homology domain-containing protein [Mycobacterium leprae]